MRFKGRCWPGHLVSDLSGSMGFGHSRRSRTCVIITPHGLLPIGKLSREWSSVILKGGCDSGRRDCNLNCLNRFNWVIYCCRGILDLVSERLDLFILNNVGGGIGRACVTIRTALLSGWGQDLV